MNNFIQHGNSIQFAAPVGGLIGGQLYKVGTFIVCIVATVLEGEQAVGHLTGVYTVPKATSLVINQGDQLYWDDTNKVVNKTSSGNTYAGKAWDGAASNDGFVNLRLGNS